MYKTLTKILPHIEKYEPDGLHFTREFKQQCQALFVAGFSISQISQLEDISQNTLKTWQKQWKKDPMYKRIGQTIEARLNLLLLRENKSDADLKEIDTLIKALEKTARIQSYENTGKPSDLNENIEKRGKKSTKNGLEKAKNQINHFSQEDIFALLEDLNATTFFHQKLFWQHYQQGHNIRYYLKSRQIGATLYFAREALLVALLTGRNQIFISASKNQSKVFKSYMQAWVRKVLDKELKGEVITLRQDDKDKSGAQLYFLATNASTAQSYSGDLYIDEFFWIKNYSDLEAVAKGMTTLSDRRLTMFSTPSSKQHEAYPTWDGSKFNEGRPKDKQLNIDVSHKALKDGKLCEDGVFRQIITVDDVVDSGYHLIDKEKLKIKFSEAEYMQLFLCEFADAAESYFKFNNLLNSAVDVVKWKDFNKFALKPYAGKVWVGYDPSRTRDDASLAIIAPPQTEKGKYRILKVLSFNDLDFAQQAEEIKKVLNRYSVEYLAIDITGIGYGVYELVKQFYPAVQKITYSVESKNELVLRANRLFNKNKIEFDGEIRELIPAFLTIKQATTQSGVVTFKADRTAQTGHADIAFAIMHGLSKYQISTEVNAGAGRSRVEAF